VVPGFDDWLTKVNVRVSVCRYFHEHDLDFKSEEPKLEFRDSHSLFIEAHQPILLDVPSMAQILLSQLERDTKLKCLKSITVMQTPKANFFNIADFLNFPSFQLLKRDLDLMMLEIPIIEKVIVRTQRRPLKPIRKIMIFSHEDSRTGAPIYALQVAQSLVQSGYDVQVVSLRDNFRSGNFNTLGSRHSYLSDHVNLGHSGSNTITHWLLTENGNQAMQNVFTKFKPDLVLANSLASCEAIRLASAASIPSILYVHEAWDIEIFNDSIQDPFALRVREALEAAPLVLFGSNTTFQHWKKTKIAINGRVAKSYRKITTYSEAEKTNAKANLKGQLGLTSNDIVFLSVATFEPRKRIDDIVHAFKSIQNPRANLILLGSIPGPTHDNIKKLVDGDSRIRLISPTSNLAPYYAAADCLIFASEEETMPLVLQEAALWEIPRIVSKYPGYQELIPSPELALLFNPKDVEGMAQQMLKFLDDDFDARWLVRNALFQQHSFSEGEITELMSGIDSLSKNWISVVPEGWLDEKN
jgi:glycosyltransferase involved in cell wall biosynthesis